MKGITPFLWFDKEAEEAVDFYTGIFDNSRITNKATYGEAGPGEKDSVMMVEFELNGREYVALNGGPYYKLTPAFSMMVNCETQEEVDHYWEKLLAGGGEESQCGWLTDKYGLSWQITPTVLMEMQRDKDEARRARVMQAMMKMVKLDIAGLKRAYDGDE